MRPEHELTPYAPAPLDGSPALIIAPHPDDEVFGCGGFVARAASERRPVRIAVLTDGAAHGDPEIRRDESLRAAERLGLPAPEHLGFMDRSLEPDDDRLGQALESLVREVNPRLVLAPSPAELHPDHRAAGMAMYTLLQQMDGLDPAMRLAAYEVSAVLRPNLLLDVSDVWDDVMPAAREFSSQLGDTRYIEIKNAIAVARCLTLPPDVKRAEAYHVVDLQFIRTHSLLEWGAAQGPVDGLGLPPAPARGEPDRPGAELEALRAQVAELRRERDEQRAILERLYRSKTWKLHSLVERFKHRRSR